MVNKIPNHVKNPRRVAATKIARQKRGPLNQKARAKLRKLAYGRRLWEHTTGPRTPEGKARSAQNGLLSCKGGVSIRGLNRELSGVVVQLQSSRDLRAAISKAMPAGVDTDREEAAEGGKLCTEDTP